MADQQWVCRASGGPVSDHGQDGCHTALLYQVHYQVQESRGIVSLGAHSHHYGSHNADYLRA